LETSVGGRNLIYYQLDSDPLGSGTGISFGLGSASVDGTWHEYARDLDADLQRAQPGVELLSVEAIRVNGSGRIDDLTLLSPDGGSMLENAEDGTTNGWTIVDDDPPGSSISNKFDADRQSNVIRLNGDKKRNIYQLEFEDNDELHNIQWKAQFDEAFSIVVWLDTSSGSRRLSYSNADTHALGSGTVVKLGLGAHTRNGEWHTITRNLQEDLEQAQPGVEIYSVRTIRAAGSGSLDDIRLF